MLREQFRRAAGGQQVDAALLELTGKFDDARLVGNAEQSASYGREQGGAYSYSPMPNSLSFLRKVPRLMPRIVAARLWLPCTWLMTTLKSGSSTSRMTRS